MKDASLGRILITATVAIVLMVPAALAQQRKGSGKTMPRYDPATEITVEGAIEEIKEVECTMCRMGMTGTHLVVKSEAGTHEVHLGPTSFLAEKNLTFAKGDPIEVTGSMVKFEGAEAVIAREVKVGDKTMALRNAQGIPLWSKGRRRS